MFNWLKLRLKDTKGSVLVAGLVLVLVMTILGLALFDLGLLESRLIQGDATSVQAFYCAEAGGARAFAKLGPAPDNPLSWDGTPQSLVTSLGSCEYVADYANATDPITLAVTGTIGGVSRTVKWSGQPFSATEAFVSGGSFSISGNPSITGQCGSVYATEDLSISGNPTIAEDATASGNYDSSGNPIIGGESGGGAPLQRLLIIDPVDFLDAAKLSLPANEVFQMMSDGRVLNGNNVEIAVLVGGEVFSGWEYKPGSDPQWVHGNDTGFDGTYYLEGGITVSGSPGTPATPWMVTIIATGNIEISGNPNLANHLVDTLLVAGLDIKINGTPQQSFVGIIAAHEQIDMSGNPVISGFIYGENASSISGMATQNILSGNPDITYDCGLEIGQIAGASCWPQAVCRKWEECQNPECTT